HLVRGAVVGQGLLLGGQVGHRGLLRRAAKALVLRPRGAGARPGRRKARIAPKARAARPGLRSLECPRHSRSRAAGWRWPQASIPLAVFATRPGRRAAPRGPAMEKDTVSIRFVDAALAR